MNIISLTAAAVVLLVGIAQAARPDPNVYYTTQSTVYATNAYTQWKNSRDACYQVGMEPLALSRENIYAAFKALRESGHKHAWIERVRTKGGWDGSYLAVQLPTDAGHLNQRELHLGELGEIVEETAHATLHITLCERPGSHSRYGAGPRPDDRRDGANRRSFELNRGQYGPYRYDDNRYNGRRYVDRGQYYGPYPYDDRRRYDDYRYNDRRYNDYRYNDRRYNDGRYNDRYEDGRYNRYNNDRYNDDRYNDRRYNDGRYNRYNNDRYNDDRYYNNDRYYNDDRYNNDRYYNDDRYNSDRRYYRDNGALRRTGGRWIDAATDSSGDRDYNRYRNRYNLSSDNYRSYDTKVPPRYSGNRRYAGYDDGYYYDRPYYGNRYAYRERSRRVEKGAKDSGDQRGDADGYSKGGRGNLRAALSDPANRKYMALPQ